MRTTTTPPTELEGLVSAVAQQVLGTTKVEREGETIDLSPPWRRVTLREAIKERTGIDVLEHPSREQLAEAMGSEPDPEEGWGNSSMACSPRRSSRR